MVLKHLFRSRAKRDTPVPAVPHGQRIYAIGDVHGRLDLLERLVADIQADDAVRGPSSTILIFLGDLVDRGPDSRGVIDFLAKLQAGALKTRFLLGNHDEVFLKAATGDAKSLRMLTRIGGRDTILSYGVAASEYDACDFAELAQLLQRKVPEEHIQFLSSFEDCISLGDYLFVHAGIRPGVAVSEQVPADLRWIRREFLDCQTAHEKVIVHGHSISEEAEVRSNRIGIDTGAFASGRLTAVGLEGSDRWFLCAEGAKDTRWRRLTN